MTNTKHSKNMLSFLVFFFFQSGINLASSLESLEGATEVRKPTCFVIHADADANADGGRLQKFVELIENRDITVFYARNGDNNGLAIGGSLPEFMNKIKTVDFVMVVGSEEFLKASEDSNSYVAEELAILRARLKKESSDITSFLLPVIFSGDVDESMPPFLRNYLACIREKSVSLEKFATELVEKMHNRVIKRTFCERRPRVLTPSPPPALKSSLEAKAELVDPMSSASSTPPSNLLDRSCGFSVRRTARLDGSGEYLDQSESPGLSLYSSSEDEKGSFSNGSSGALMPSPPKTSPNTPPRKYSHVVEGPDKSSSRIASQLLNLHRQRLDVLYKLYEVDRKTIFLLCFGENEVGGLLDSGEKGEISDESTPTVLPFSPQEGDPLGYDREPLFSLMIPLQGELTIDKNNDSPCSKKGSGSTAPFCSVSDLRVSLITQPYRSPTETDIKKGADT